MQSVLSKKTLYCWSHFHTFIPHLLKYRYHFQFRVFSGYQFSNVEKRACGVASISFPTLRDLSLFTSFPLLIRCISSNYWLPLRKLLIMNHTKFRPLSQTLAMPWQGDLPGLFIAKLIVASFELSLLYLLFVFKPRPLAD